MKICLRNEWLLRLFIAATIIFIQCQDLFDNTVNSVVKSIMVVLLFFMSMLFSQGKVINLKVVYWCLLMIAVSIISLFYTWNMQNSIGTLYRIGLSYLIAICLSQSISSRERLLFAIKSFMIGGTIYCLLVFLIQGPIDLITNGINQEISGNTLTAFSTVSISAAMLLSWCFINEKSKPMRFCYLLLWGFVYMMCLFSGRRKAMLFPIIFILFLLLIRVKKMNVKKMLSQLFGISILIIGMCLLMWYSIKNDYLFNMYGYRLYNLLNTFFGDASVIDKSLITRTAAHSIGWTYVRNEIFLGVGIGNFPELYSTIAHAHNNYLELWCTIGVHGLIIYYSMYVYIFNNCRRHVSDKIALLFFALIISYLIMEFQTTTYYTNGYIILITLAGCFCNKKLYDVPVKKNFSSKKLYI